MITLIVHWSTIQHTLLYLYVLSCLLRATAISYTTLDEKAFYYIPFWDNSQFFSLDLTRSWNAKEAPLQLLPAVPLPLRPVPRTDLPFSQGAPLLVNHDKKSLIYLDSNRTPSVYNITTQKWQLGTPLTVPDANKERSSVYSYQVATDPSTGIAYIPSIANTMVNTNNFPMYTYSTFQGYIANVTKTFISGVPVQYAEYSAVWSTVRKSILFYGGSMTVNGRYKSPGLMEYQPSTNQWIKFKTQGSFTGPMQDACMASAYNGTKVVIFGSIGGPYSINILDVQTLVWTEGTDAEDDQVRSRVSCTAVGDHFIVAGGSRASNDSQEVAVYNIKLDRWTDSYEPPQSPIISSGVGESPTTETASPVAERGQHSGEGMPSGAKIGLIAGGSSTMIILLIGSAFLIRRRNMRRLSQVDVIDKNLPKFSLGRTEKDNNSPDYSAYPRENMSHSSPPGLDQECKGRDYASSPSLSDLTPEPSECRQQHPVELNRTLREAPSPSPNGHFRIQGARRPQHHAPDASFPSLDDLLKPQADRNPQHHSSSIPAVAVQQWQCTQPGQNPQYILPPPFAPTKPALVYYPRHDLQDEHDGHHDRLDYRPVHHDQCRDNPQDDRNLHNHAVDYSAEYHIRHANDPQAGYDGPTKAEDYLEMYHGPRMNAPQEHGRSSTENDTSFTYVQRRLDPQDHTRHSAASRLAFYQTRPLNNPQDHGYQIGLDDDILFQEIQRIKAQQQEHLLQQQNLERVRLEKEVKLRTLAGCAKHPLPREQH